MTQENPPHAKKPRARYGILMAAVGGLLLVAGWTPVLLGGLAGGKTGSDTFNATAVWLVTRVLGWPLVIFGILWASRAWSRSHRP